MRLRTFMFASDALRIEEGIVFEVRGAPARAPEPSPADNRARNAQAMQAFTAMMGGVQKRGRRR